MYHVHACGGHESLNGVVYVYVSIEHFSFVIMHISFYLNVP